MNPAKLQEALHGLHEASLAVENRARLSAQVHLEEAHDAAAVAFPAGSDASFSLLALVGEVEDAAAAAGLLEVAS